MPEKDPTTYTLLTYAWVVGISSWGAIASYARKVKKGETRFSIAELVGELSISGFVGTLTFFVCEAGDVPQVMAAPIIGISAHMGSRAILLMEDVGESFVFQCIKKFRNKDDNN